MVSWQSFMYLHLKLLDIDHPLTFEESKLRQIEAHHLIYLRNGGFTFSTGALAKYIYFKVILATSLNPFVNLAVLLGVFLLTVEANHCRKVDWWHSFDKKGWSRCSHSTEYLNGIYRNVHKGRNDGLYLIEEGWCCKAPSPNQHQPSHCTIANWWAVLDRSVNSVIDKKRGTYIQWVQDN